jgi:hypothetical protein
LKAAFELFISAADGAAQRNKQLLFNFSITIAIMAMSSNKKQCCLSKLIITHHYDIFSRNIVSDLRAAVGVKASVEPIDTTTKPYFRNRSTKAL